MIHLLHKKNPSLCLFSKLSFVGKKHTAVLGTGIWLIECQKLCDIFGGEDAFGDEDTAEIHLEYATDKHGEVEVGYYGEQGSVTIVDMNGAMKLIKPNNQQRINLADVRRNVSTLR